MDDLVMGQHQDIFFTGKICESERHLVVVVFAEIRVQLHVLQEIVHPSHIPLKGKAKTLVLRFPGDFRPCGGLFRDDNGAVSAVCHHTV